MEKECSICHARGILLKQLNVPLPPWHLFYCKDCWEKTVATVKGKAEQLKRVGLSRGATEQEIMKRLPEIEKELKQ